MLNVRERRKQQAKQEAVDLIGLYGEHRAAAALNVHIATVRRWYSGEIAPPTPVLIALRALVKSQLPGMEHRTWEGWCFSVDGNLHEPCGKAHSAGSIMAMHYERQLIAHQRRQIIELEAKLHKALESSNRAANDPLVRPSAHAR